jgi:hypothetical protein
MRLSRQIILVMLLFVLVGKSGAQIYYSLSSGTQSFVTGIAPDFNNNNVVDDEELSFIAAIDFQNLLANHSIIDYSIISNDLFLLDNVVQNYCRVFNISDEQFSNLNEIGGYLVEINSFSDSDMEMNLHSSLGGLNYLRTENGTTPRTIKISWVGTWEGNVASANVNAVFDFSNFSSTIDTIQFLTPINFAEINISGFYLKDSLPKSCVSSCNYDINVTGGLLEDRYWYPFSSINISGASNLNFLCVPDNHESKVTSTSTFGVSSDCSLANSTNQINNQNTPLATALINANPTVDVNGDNIIQGWELVQADTIIIPNANIDSLNGIHLAENLVYLDVSNNNLDTIELANFPNLQYLNVSGNNMSGLDFSGVFVNESTERELQTLGSGYNLDTLIVSDNNLTELDVSELGISFLAAEDNPSLQTICVSQAQLDNEVQDWTKDPSATFSASCSVITSSNNVVSMQNELYPNPAHNVVQFSDGLNVIVGLEGKVVFQNTAQQTSVNVGAWSKGVYFAKFKNGENIKLVIR